ncbi:MAG: small, acid-soluble spore protein, alpha/beta type [Symbiobacteriia bacterium]
MATRNSNAPVVKNARTALDRLKFEVANEVGVPLNQGYNGDLPAREAGKVGGQMVKRMIQVAEQSLGGGTQQQ